MDLSRKFRTWLSSAQPNTNTLEFYEGEDRDWRWTIKAANNRIIAASSEGFTTKADAKRNYKLVKDAMRGLTQVVETPLVDRPAKRGGP